MRRAADLYPGEAKTDRRDALVIANTARIHARQIHWLDTTSDTALQCFTTLRSALAGWPPDADCALLDLGLPDAMGLPALQELRARIPNVPIVVLKRRVDDGIGPDALAAGAQDYLVKGQVDSQAWSGPCGAPWSAAGRRSSSVISLLQAGGRLEVRAGGVPAACRR